jgi:PAS domain S-box-containing protein
MSVNEPAIQSRICPPPLDESVLVSLYKGIPEAIIVIEFKSRCIVYWNEGATLLFGYSAQEVLQQTTERLYLDKNWFDRIYQTSIPDIEQSGCWRGEWQYRRRDGSLFAAEATCTLLQTDKGAYVVKVIREVTERKEAEKIILELNQRLAQRVIEQTSELMSKTEELQHEEAQRKQVEQILGNLLRNITNYAVLISDGDGRIVDWNRTATRVLGRESDDMADQRLSIFFADEEGRQALIKKALDEASDQGTFRDYQLLVRKDGSKFYARVIVFALRDDADGLQGFLILLRDDSQERNLREKLREKEHLAAIGTAASMLAHEIGNPLNGISTTVQLLERFISREGIKAPPHMLATLKDLKSEIDRLTSLLNEFKTIARPQKLSVGPVNLASLIQETISGLDMDGRGDVQTVWECSPDLPPIRGDAAKLKQALLNLFKNAVEAMPYGGTLSIKGYFSGGSVCIDISDTGIGIPDDLKVFDLFSSTKPHGTGLGLFIVQQIVLAHDGVVSYASTVGKGTIFHLTLPASVTPEAVAGTTATSFRV